jgi:hypothetical protein
MLSKFCFLLIITFLLIPYQTIFSDPNNDMIGITVPEHTLLSKFDFEGNCFDTSGDNVNGINHNVTFIEGKVNNQSASFNGSSFIDLGLNTAYITNIGSIAAWVKTTEGGVVFSNGNKLSDFAYIFFLIHDGSITFYSWDGNYSNNGNIYNGNSDINIFDNQWHHVVWQSNGTSWIGYIDGAKIDLIRFRGDNSGEWFNDYENITNSFSIGVLDRPNPYRFFIGGIDDLRIYNYVLSEIEVIDLFQDSTTNSLQIHTTTFIRLEILLLSITVVVVLRSYKKLKVIK